MTPYQELLPTILFVRALWCWFNQRERMGEQLIAQAARLACLPAGQTGQRIFRRPS